MTHGSKNGRLLLIKFKSNIRMGFPRPDIIVQAIMTWEYELTLGFYLPKEQLQLKISWDE